MKKYELTDITKTENIFGKPVTLHRIRALKDFGNVKAGDLGGWVEHEGNLSQDGDCWIYYPAIVCGTAKLEDKRNNSHFSWLNKIKMKISRYFYR